MTDWIGQLAKARDRIERDRARALFELQKLIGADRLRTNDEGQVVVSRRQYDLLLERANFAEDDPTSSLWALSAVSIVIETPQEQRTRILQENLDLSPSQYDLAIIFGYPPESWDGMYRLAAIDYPITQLTRNWALVREVVEVPGTHDAALTWTGREKRRWVLRRAVL